MMTFEDLPNSARVWVYQSQRRISQEEQSQIQQKLDAFVRQWAAHGNQLFGAGAVLHDYFIVLAVDEAMTGASGCSIDSSVHFIRSIENVFDLSLFDRMHVLTELSGTQQIVHFSDLEKHPDAFVFNPLVKNLGELRTQWKVRVSESGLVR